GMCYHRSGYGGRQEVCSCTKNLCNHSGRFELSYYLAGLLTASQMQEYGSGIANKSGESRDATDGHCQDGFHIQHHYPVIQKGYGVPNKELSDQKVTTYSRGITSYCEASTSQQYHNSRYTNPLAPTFSSPPNSPLVGLVFDPTSSNYSSTGMMAERLNSDRRTQNTWSLSHQEPIGTGAKKKIVKSHDKRNAYNADPRYQERFKDNSTETDRHRNVDRNLASDSTSSLDFFAEGEKMVSELCNIPDSNYRNEGNSLKPNQKGSIKDDDKNKASGSSDMLLTALDKIVIHDQIPNQIVQLAIEACTDAENIAIAHHNRPCFKNIHSICAKTRSNVQKPDSAVANLHSQGIPWVIKNFIFSFVRILDGWKGVKELLSEKHETFSRIENKYYSQNIRECFVQWQAVTKEMLTHIYKTFKCLDHGFTMEQKSFTHNYYATNSAAPRHQNQNKFQTTKAHVSTPRPVSASPQAYNVMQPPWAQSQTPAGQQTYNDNSWPSRSNVTYKKFPIVHPPNQQNFYPLNDQVDMDNYQKSQYKCDPCLRETKPRQSWTITNVPDFRTLERMCLADQKDLYTQLKHKMDAELGKSPEQPILSSIPSEILQRREMELKAKMIPLSHVEKSLIPSMSSSTELRSCYVPKNNSCGDTKEEADFFAAWGQMVQKEPSEFLTHHTHNIQVPSNVMTISNNISGPVQFIDPENDEFNEISKVYMKPGSYKVPIKPSEPTSSPFLQSSTQDIIYENPVEEISNMKMKVPFSQVTLAPQPKYNLESWPCLIQRRADDAFHDDQKVCSRPTLNCLDMRSVESLDILSSMMSDRAWEAAKQSAPKLMDFIYEGVKSDTARLYDALSFCANVEYSSDVRNSPSEKNDVWNRETIYNSFNNLNSEECPQNKSLDNINTIDATTDVTSNDQRQSPVQEPIENIDFRSEESEKSNRCPNYDQTGHYIRNEKQKSKVAVSGMWYHPKKKKPLSASIVKRFEDILTQLSHFNEANFIQLDMDIKVAPRFYEVVKYPMCLNDISTKLKNSSYTEYEQVVQDFRRIFNNVRLYLKNYPDTTMKKNLNKVSSEFEKILNEAFQNNKDGGRNKSIDNAENKDLNSKSNEKENEKHKADSKKGEIVADYKTSEDGSG
ncbi:hypothetical protein KGM_200995B, partial [Danaus plexippus plexippus]